MHRRAWNRLGISVALLVCVGCGDDDDCGPATPGPFPTIPQGRATRTLAAGATPTITSGSPQAPTPTALTTPGGATPTPGSETPIVTATPSFSPTPTFIPATDGVLEIEHVGGAPGSTVTVAVTLSEGTGIAGTQNDLLFDGLSVAVAANANGTPDCAVNPSIRKSESSFGFQPPHCTVGVDCTGIRAIVISFRNLDPIPTGSVLYTCNVTITANAAFGSLYPLRCDLAGASDPDGFAVGLACEDGGVAVGGV